MTLFYPCHNKKNPHQNLSEVWGRKDPCHKKNKIINKKIKRPNFLSCPKFSSDLKFFWTQNYFKPKILLVPKFVWPQFSSDVNFFFDSKFFLGPKFFSNPNFLGPIFWTQNFFHPLFFWHLRFLLHPKFTICWFENFLQNT